MKNRPFYLVAVAFIYLTGMPVQLWADDNAPAVSPVHIAGQTQPADVSKETARQARAARLRAKIRAMEERRLHSGDAVKASAPKKLGMTTVRGSDRIKAKMKAVEEDKSDSRKWLQKWYTRIRKGIAKGNKNRREKFKKALEKERAARMAKKRAKEK